MDSPPVSIDWDAYEIYDPGVLGLLGTLPRSEARAAFDRLMAAKSARIRLLEGLLEANGVKLDTDDAAIQRLNEWFVTHVERDPVAPGRLLPDWYSVVNDIALFLGEVMIARCPNLHWEFFTWGKKSVEYQRHVIMGFGSEDPKFQTNVDIDMAIAFLGHRVVRGLETEPDEFVHWIKNVESRA